MYIIFIIINIITFLLYGVDKLKAKKHKRRISEFTLLLFTFCFGGLGAIAGMLLFRHKTRKVKFKVLVPLYLALQVLLIYYLKNFLFTI